MTDETIWITTELDLQGRYMLAVHFDDDHSIHLGRQSAFEYAHAILTAVQVAEYDAALFGQLMEKGNDEAAAATILQDFRAKRPKPNFAGYEPFSLEPGVSLFTKKGFLTVILNGERAGQWELDAARQHAMAAIESLIITDLDETYYKLLREKIGLEEGTARQVVADLVRFR